MRNKLFVSYYKSPMGELIIGDFENNICLCDWRYRKMRKSIDSRICNQLNTQFTEEKTELIQEVINQLEAYFNKERMDFSIPLLLVGTEFQKEVWNQLWQIPYGKTESYLSLSKKLGNEKAIRAVATANGANAISIIIPCHRVIGSDGNLMGYAGGLPAKKKLLELEGALNNGQLELF